MSTPKELIERLRSVAAPVLSWDGYTHEAPQLSHADAIEAASTIERLVEALEKLISYNEDIRDSKINYRPDDHIEVARRALTGGE